MPENNRKSMFADNVVGEVVDTATGQTRVLRSKPAPNREVALQDSERATAGSVPTDAGGSAEPPARDRLEAVLADEPLPSYMDGAAESEKAVYSAAKRIKAERDELRAEIERSRDERQQKQDEWIRLGMSTERARIISSFNEWVRTLPRIEGGFGPDPPSRVHRRDSG